jgi:hypothetical protein
MPHMRLIPEADLVEFAALLRKNGWSREAFELEEDVFDPVTAEVESATGEVGVRCIPSEVVEVYRVGSGSRWIADFAADLHVGKFGAPART